MRNESEVPFESYSVPSSTHTFATVSLHYALEKQQDFYETFETLFSILFNLTEFNRNCYNQLIIFLIIIIINVDHFKNMKLKKLIF